MSSKPVERILITNDDGYRAEGLKVMEQIANELSDDVWVIAPEHDQSGTSHSISLHQPLRVYSWSERHHSVAGTPSDCVLLGVEQLMKDRPPSLILSGVNCGGNVADAVPYSGTVGAAMTALLLGLPAIALSQTFRNRDQVRWDTAARLGPPLVRDLVTNGWPTEVCLNINFPDEPADAIEGLQITRQGRGSISGVQVEERFDTRGLPYYWLGFSRSPEQVTGEDTDVAALRSRCVSVNPLRFERAPEGEWQALADRLSACLKGA
ncbi:5'/3'-nucleotidase SurE [Alkalilimnicola ehrlichii]|uniref:5'-nucleotidase SurE n=1 Tax=Alkalilimnicola ehrlichii TaxID=351052 RepID=A0A3E0WPP9_9GAMM|nr:5'/3'-nucleotidase SurE [Alkalilimnicola ehrlichii]RFA27267.1 5'/3'-nucleotidase SurE [Alkalilimnicola ehrlichii]RFA34379.1 5'/3'-nucleotidase SurE [Alkalilimnicola ehrlichii]